MTNKTRPYFIDPSPSISRQVLGGRANLSFSMGLQNLLVIDTKLGEILEGALASPEPDFSITYEVDGDKPRYVFLRQSYSRTAANFRTYRTGNWEIPAPLAQYGMDDPGDRLPAIYDEGFSLLRQNPELLKGMDIYSIFVPGAHLNAAQLAKQTPEMQRHLVGLRQKLIAK